jgi:hypothetical protein
MNVNNKNNHSLKLTDYKALIIRKHKGFETDGSEEDETATVPQNKLINWS